MEPPACPARGGLGVPPKLTACVILGAVHGVGRVDELVAGSLSAEFAVGVAQDHLASAEEMPQPDLPVSKWKGTFTALPGPLKQDLCSPRGSHPGLNAKDTLGSEGAALPQQGWGRTCKQLPH